VSHRFGLGHKIRALLKRGKMLKSSQGQNRSEKSVQHHLQARSAPRSLLVERADFPRLPRVAPQIVKVSFRIQNVLPIAHHPEPP
jgi:hypothetical protein